MVVLKWDVYFYTNTYPQLNYHRQEIVPLPMQITLGLENHNTYAYNFVFIYVATINKHNSCILL